VCEGSPLAAQPLPAAAIDRHACELDQLAEDLTLVDPRECTERNWSASASRSRRRNASLLVADGGGRDAAIADAAHKALATWSTALNF
jgi:hypothetical protein